ncbi:MAG: site-2 protease family protein [Candidatus Pacebacteria bacterium]|nr:site-2 protease family protein [Candidatus Paceibacterota bacterium]
MNIIIFIVILLVLVIVHEFGHFYSAKKFGIRVDEFGFGFPPKLFGIKKGETEYTFNALPFGGFVKIFGENPDDENTNGPDKERSFVHKAKWKQAVVLFAGVFANFMLAWLLFSFGFMSGLPTSVGSEAKGHTLSDVHLVVVSVLADSPAEKAGLSSGDKIVSLRYVDSKKVEIKEGVDVTPESLKSFVLAHGGHEIEIGYLRGKNSEIEVAQITPMDRDGQPSIGISMDQIGTSKLPLFGALVEGMKLNWSVAQGTVVGLYTLIKQGIQGTGSFASVTGPVGMVSIVGEAYRFGFAYLLSFAGLISMNLAIINLLPLPALDGGRLFFLLIEKIKGSRMNPKVVNTANLMGFAALIILMILVTYHDIAKLL